MIYQSYLHHNNEYHEFLPSQVHRKLNLLLLLYDHKHWRNKLKRLSFLVHKRSIYHIYLKYMEYLVSRLVHEEDKWFQFQLLQLSLKQLELVDLIFQHYLYSIAELHLNNHDQNQLHEQKDFLINHQKFQKHRRYIKSLSLYHKSSLLMAIEPLEQK